MVVLIVDDNPSVRRLLRMAVSDDAREVLEAENGAEGLRRYREVQPDVVLMDVRMPHMDGLAATRAILLHDSHARVVIVTDHDHQEMRQAAVEAGACGFVPKQDFTEIAALLRTMPGHR